MRTGTGRVVVTGGAGFVGSHVADAFLERGSEVLVIDDLSTGSTANVPREARFEELDIRDGHKLDAAVRGFAPSVVCHLAAQASVIRSVQDPAYDLDVNVAGTLNVLEAASSAGAVVVFASTGGAMYGEGAPLPTPEDVEPRPLSPYGASKLAGEAYVATWARLHELPHVVLRLANVYGPRQEPHGEGGVVAIFSVKLLEQEAPTIYGDGTQTRDFVYAGDVARAFVLAVEARRPGLFNVGTGRETSVNDLFDLLRRLAGTDGPAAFAPPRQGELQRSALDCSRIAEALSWRPTVELADGLVETFASYGQLRV